MKILCLSHAQYITVALPKIIEQAEAVAGLGHDITIVCTSKTDRFKIRRFSRNGVHYITTPSLLWGKFRHGADLWDVLARIVVLLKGESFDVIHAIDSRPTVILPALVMKKLRRIPLIMEWSDWYGRNGTIRNRSSRLYELTFGRIETFFEEYFRNYADYSLVISTLLRKRLKAMGYPAHKIFLQCYGCDTNRYRPYEKEYMRNKLNLPNSPIILCYVGSLFKTDLQLLLNTLKILHQKKEIQILTVLIGEYNLSEDLKESLNLKITGRIQLPVVHEFICASDLCLIPMKVSIANKARWPSKFSDYLNAGRPTIATKISDFESIFTKHNLGFLSEGDTHEKFSEMILSAIEKRQEWDAMGKSCRLFAERYLDVVKLAKERISLYDKLIKR